MIEAHQFSTAFVENFLTLRKTPFRAIYSYSQRRDYTHRKKIMFPWIALGIGIGWVTFPLLIWAVVAIPTRIDDWLHPIPGQHWKPRKKKGYKDQ